MAPESRKAGPESTEPQAHHYLSFVSVSLLERNRKMDGNRP